MPEMWKHLVAATSSHPCPSRRAVSLFRPLRQPLARTLAVAPSRMFLTVEMEHYYENSPKSERWLARS
jgi:hypothetical protein